MEGIFNIPDGPKIIGDISDMNPKVGLQVYENGEPVVLVYGFEQIEKYINGKDWKKIKREQREPKEEDLY